MTKTGILTIAVMLTTGAPDTQPCVLKAGLAIGCMGNQLEGGPENAADLYDRYQSNYAEIGNPNTADFVRRFGCLRITDRARKMTFRSIAKAEVATGSGPVIVRYVQVSGTVNPDYRPILWIADPFFSGECTPATMASSSSRN